ncbi:MAG: hypothetical protein NTZ49_01575 [Candidatus Parcubacteria bacterium]|nr:hypothetical protein [Candidatus Parcubacteria bacterium]
MKKIFYSLLAIAIVVAIALIFLYLSKSTVLTQNTLHPLNKTELKNFIDHPDLRPKVNPWQPNINFSGQRVNALYESIRYYDNAFLVRDCAQDANEALTRHKQYLNEIIRGDYSNSKVIEDTGTYFAIEDQGRYKLQKSYFINCNYIKFTSQTVAYNREPTKIANIPRRISQTEATGYIAFLQKLRSAMGTVIAQQIKQEKAIIKADILRMINIGGDWGLCDEHSSNVDHYEINIDTGDVIYWQEAGDSITGTCHPNPLE